MCILPPHQPPSPSSTTTTLIIRPHQRQQEIGAKYPAWLQSHRDTLPSEELARYEKQYDIITKICALYDQPSPDFTLLVGLLQEVWGGD